MTTRNHREPELPSPKTQLVDTDHEARMKLAVERAQRTAKWARTMTQVMISQSHGDQPRWHVTNFLGPKKSESRGVVDLLAMRRNQTDPGLPLKRGDLFEIVILQVKGGKAAWPSQSDRARLRKVGALYKVKAILLSEWKKGAKPKVYQLKGDDWGEPIDPATIFCPEKPGPAKKAAPVASAFSSSSSEAESAGKKAWATRRKNMLAKK